MVDNSDNFIYSLAIQYLKTAQELESKGKIEDSFKNFKEAANKFHFLVKNEEDPAKLKDYQDLTKKTIDSGLWLKL